MTQEQVDTGYGTYGRQTKAAYAAAQESQNTSNNSSNTSNNSKRSLFLSKSKANDYLNSVDSTEDLALNMSNDIST
jgi:hypothetical protein